MTPQVKEQRLRYAAESRGNRADVSTADVLIEIQSGNDFQERSDDGSSPLESTNSCDASPKKEAVLKKVTFDIPELSDEAKRKAFLKNLEKDLASVQKKHQKAIKKLISYDLEINAKEKEVCNNTLDEVSKRYLNFLEKLENNPSLENKELLDQAIATIEVAIMDVVPSSVLKSSIDLIIQRMSFQNAHFQNAYPRLKDQCKEMIDDLEKNQSELPQDKILLVADHCDFLLRLALGNFDPDHFNSIKVGVLKTDYGRYLLDHWRIPYEAVLGSSSLRLTQQDEDSIKAIRRADNLLKQIQKQVEMFDERRDNESNIEVDREQALHNLLNNIDQTIAVANDVVDDFNRRKSDD